MFGNKRKVSEILFITTDNAMKWLKFTDYGIDFNYWCNKVIENNCNFGIVKTAHESKQGIADRTTHVITDELSDGEFT